MTVIPASLAQFREKSFPEQGGHVVPLCVPKETSLSGMGIRLLSS